MQQSLGTNISQRVIFTAKLAQSLKILAMNSIQLDEYISDCLESNPLLEQEAGDDGDITGTKEIANQAENDWREQGDDRWYTMYSQTPGWRPDMTEPQLQAEKSIQESLHEQIDCQPMRESERGIAHAIIDVLEDGYFRDDANHLAREMSCTPARIMAVLEQVVQRLSPAGIGARDLTECLLLQLDRNTDADRLAHELLTRHADHLFDDDATLAAITGRSLEQIGMARARLRRLDPFPGHAARDDFSIYVRPEVIFHRQPDHSIRIEIPDYGWRGLRFTDKWRGRRWEGEERAFMSHANREASWLLQALDQRRKTLYKVAHCLAKRQKRFLEFGPIGLKPLTLHEVAAEVGLHESTISRVTHGKYAQTPLGLVEMKQFFSASLPVRGGGSIAVYRVQQRIRALIESEPPTRPIADQTISEVLQTEGVQIARRTVAKYREQLGFAPSHQRKRGLPGSRLQKSISASS